MPFEVILFVIGLAGILAYFAYRYFKHGSLRGAVYGSSVLETIGEMELKPLGGVSTTLRIHVLEDRRIILEKSSRAVLSYALDGYSLSITRFG